MKLLGFDFDNKLKFKIHIDHTCKRPNRKLNISQELLLWEVRNSRVMNSIYETELHKMTSHLELLTQSRKIKNYTSSY